MARLTRKVGYTVTVYADAGSPHEMGELYEGEIVTLYDPYETDRGVWYRIDEQANQHDGLYPPHTVEGGADKPVPYDEADYKQYWVLDQPDGLFLAVTDTPDTDEPTEPEEPSVGPTDAEIGRVVRYLFGL